MIMIVKKVVITFKTRMLYDEFVEEYLHSGYIRFEQCDYDMKVTLFGFTDISTEACCAGRKFNIDFDWLGVTVYEEDISSLHYDIQLV